MAMMAGLASDAICNGPLSVHIRLGDHHHERAACNPASRHGPSRVIMVFAPPVRKFVLTVHVAVSVGWFGSVATFLAFSIAGLFSENADTVRSAYAAMNLIGLFVLIPFSLAALATGLINALGSQWGVLRHYWIIAKLLLTIMATTLLLLHQYSAVTEAARRVRDAVPGTLPSAGRLGAQLVVDASLAALALLTITAIALYKPRGLTGYGRRKLELGNLWHSASRDASSYASSLGRNVLVGAIGAILAAFTLVHLTGLHGR